MYTNEDNKDNFHLVCNMLHAIKNALSIVPEENAKSLSDVKSTIIKYYAVKLICNQAFLQQLP